MRKSIELGEDELNIVDEFQKRNQMKNFSKAVRAIIRNNTETCTCKGEKESLSDENFALLADAIVKLNDKIDIIVGTLAPKSAGEIT
jgi:hypothetical protein